MYYAAQEDSDFITVGFHCSRGGTLVLFSISLFSLGAELVFKNTFDYYANNQQTVRNFDR